MRESPPQGGWLHEVRVTFDRDELESFFDGFSPMESPTDLLDSLFSGMPENDGEESLPFAA